MSEWELYMLIEQRGERVLRKVYWNDGDRGKPGDVVEVVTNKHRYVRAWEGNPEGFTNTPGALRFTWNTV